MTDTEPRKPNRAERRAAAKQHRPPRSAVEHAWRRTFRSVQTLDSLPGRLARKSEDRRARDRGGDR